jgi:hypothetical protein
MEKESALRAAFTSLHDRRFEPQGNIDPLNLAARRAARNGIDRLLVEFGKHNRQHARSYIWSFSINFNVVCMPQDKRNEILDLICYCLEVLESERLDKLVYLISNFPLMADWRAFERDLRRLMSG